MLILNKFVLFFKKSTGLIVYFILQKSEHDVNQLKIFLSSGIVYVNPSQVTQKTIIQGLSLCCAMKRFYLLLKMTILALSFFHEKCHKNFSVIRTFRKAFQQNKRKGSKLFLKKFELRFLKVITFHFKANVST